MESFVAIGLFRFTLKTRQHKFSTEHSSARSKFLTEVLGEELEPLVTGIYEFQYRDKSMKKVQVDGFGQSTFRRVTKLKIFLAPLVFK